jgi:sterol desaturase/sphingolipid hydroxylase (fatty acid hydroxylase superfamily)
MAMFPIAAVDLLERFLRIAFGVTVEGGVRYFLAAGLGWLVFYVLFRRRWWHRKIIPRLPPAADLRRELLFSALTLLVYAVVGAVSVLAAKAGWTQMYYRIEKHGWGWFWASLLIAIFIHDAYFYWTHRAMHHPRLFRWVHRTHHRSTNPTPWASYSFDPLEAAVHAFIFPLLIFSLPIHPLAFFLFMAWQITFNVLGHTGFEIYPRWFLRSPLGIFLNTPTNHVMHHQYFRGNYGLYFNIWDRLMGTNQARYQEQFEEVTSRPPAQPVTAEPRPETRGVTA